MPEIRIEKLAKSYGAYHAIRSLDLVIPKGAFCVLLGPSGCGKSTTLNCIAGLEEITAGRILLGGRDVSGLPPHQRDIAMVFQSSLLYPHMTGLQNIRMSLRGAKQDPAGIEKRIARTVAMLDIARLLDKKPAMMSGGERQRVAMAKAVVRDPAAFLMDEPLAALDAALRQSLRADLVHLQKQLGITTVFVTHDQTEAMTMGDMIVVMNQGKIEQAGSPQEIYASPKTRFVAGFLGTPPMNFLKGSLVDMAGEPGFQVGSARLSLPRSIPWPVAGGDIELGIRPQHVRLASEPPPNAIKVSVYAVECLGRENVAILEDETGNTLRVLTDPGIVPRIGERLFAAPDMEKVHFFN